MKEQVELFLNKATELQIAEHLFLCDAEFVPPLRSRVEIGGYARKITQYATRFEAWSNGALVGLVAAYCNDRQQRLAHITTVSVLRNWQGKRIARRLLDKCRSYAKANGFERVRLEVNELNVRATSLYEKLGFRKIGQNADISLMELNSETDDCMSTKRDYNAEIQDVSNHQYAYNFDFDVMHPFMLRSFEPFFKQGSLLELGSFKGAFTTRLLSHFHDVTCVEASSIAIEEARRTLGNQVQFVNSLFEEATLPRRYDNIVFTHVLEHLDDPVQTLKRINTEWLAEAGRCFLVCPNANAPSRQIAVKMGLITHNSAVTPAEAEHGHRRTYSLDTLERDAVAAGLKVVHRSGIFFKALANFQWDRLLSTDIISKEYLEGCYKLGQQYPDLCASVFLLCERGDRQ
jgi:ribosomal protein S18 acetylase RimI-like enzyme/SAM-dependent methyltransferase